MIRATVPADTPPLLLLAEETGVFKPHEIVALQEVLDDYHELMHGQGHRCVTSEVEGQIAGFAYYAPAAMTDRSWYLYWIAVTKKIQAKGIGGELLAYAEQDIRHFNGRIMFIETSSLPHYDLTRKFYLKNGYKHATSLKDFYAEGDHMEVFSKKFGG
jgi:GNAT superfamily N-acetyltransferase